jgi:hypothetical protein
LLCSFLAFPADYGLERMAQEAVMGPRGIFKPAAASAGASGKQASNCEEEEEADGAAAAEEEESESGEEGSGASGSDSGAECVHTATRTGGRSTCGGIHVAAA